MTVMKPEPEFTNTTGSEASHDNSTLKSEQRGVRQSKINALLSHVKFEISEFVVLQSWMTLSGRPGSNTFDWFFHLQHVYVLCWGERLF